MRPPPEQIDFTYTVDGDRMNFWLVFAESNPIVAGIQEMFKAKNIEQSVEEDIRFGFSPDDVLNPQNPNSKKSLY